VYDCAVGRNIATGYQIETKNIYVYDISSLKAGFLKCCLRGTKVTIFYVCVVVYVFCSSIHN
jgi:hypothetical protein